MLILHKIVSLSHSGSILINRYCGVQFPFSIFQNSMKTPFVGIIIRLVFLEMKCSNNQLSKYLLTDNKEHSCRGSH